MFAIYPLTFNEDSPGDYFSYTRLDDNKRFLYVLWLQFMQQSNHAIDNKPILDAMQSNAHSLNRSLWS